MTRPSTKATSTAGRAKPQAACPGSAHTAAAARAVTRKEMPVLVTTSSIVRYRVVVAAYGDGAEKGAHWAGAPYCGWGCAPQPAYCWPLPAAPKPRLKAGLLLGI